MANIRLQFLVGLLILPLAAVPVGVILALLYIFHPTKLVTGFMKFGGLIALPGSHIKSLMVDGMNISYMDRPAKDDNQPTLVFVHGITAQKVGWILLLRQLPSSWRIVALDLPGHGESGFSEDLTYNEDMIVDIMHKLFVALDLKKFHIVGESLGSVYAFQYASTHPERIASRIIMCPPGFHILGAKHTPTADYFYHEKQGQKHPFLPTSPTEFQKLLDLVLHQPKQFRLPKHLLKAILNIQMKYYPNFEKVMNDVVLSFKENTEQIVSVMTSNDTPLLGLWGQNDQMCDVSGAKILKKIVPRSKVVIINDCGHALSVEKPEKCAQLIKEFITKRGSSHISGV